MTKLRFADRRTLLRLAVAAVLMVGIGIALGWRADQTDESPASQMAKEPWSVQPPKSEDPTKDLALLTSRHPWTGNTEAKKEEAAAHKVPPAWRLVGIVQSGKEKFALVTTGQSPRPRPAYLRIGDALPDGSILVQITSDSAKTEMRSIPPSSSPPASPPASTSAIAHTYRLFEKK